MAIASGLALKTNSEKAFLAAVRLETESFALNSLRQQLMVDGDAYKRLDYHIVVMTGRVGWEITTIS